MTRPSSRLRRIALVAALSLAGPCLAIAQMPSAAQKSAIRSACAGDYQSLCAGVPTGGSAALQCLRGHLSALSPDCQSAVGALSQGGQPTREAPAPPPPSRLSPMQACRGDYRAFCAGIPPGGGRALFCLRRHGPELSPACQASLQALGR